MRLIDEKVIMNRNELLVIRNLITNYSSLLSTINSYLQTNNEEIEVSIYFIKSIFEELSERVDFVEKYVVTGVNEELEQKFKDKVALYRSINVNDLVLEDDIDKISKLYELVNEIISISNDLYKLRDYIKYMTDVISSLSQFCSEEVVNEIKTEYESALASYDIESTKNVVEKAQAIILEHWQEFITDVDTYEGGAFNFICHSTDSTKFEGDFYTKYVSCSLLTDELTDTYRRGFGFIMSPKDIVAASSSDMYVINNSESEEGLLSYTVVKRLDGPEKIIKEAIELKRSSNKKNPDSKVYTEVVVQGFNPIGIFCLTDGSKMLDDNYTAALKLKEYFPNLKIIKLDITKNKTDKELKSIKRKLIERIRRHLNMTEYSNDGYYESFDRFWDNYQELIKSGNYTEDDIIKLFKENDELLSIFIDERKLFDNYDIYTVKYILYYNYKFRIIDIINGNCTDVLLGRLSDNLQSYKSDKRLEQLIPGIANFLKLYPCVLLSDEDKYKICSFNNFEDINNYLGSILHDREKQSPTFEADDTINRFFQEDISLTNLYELYNTIKSLYNVGRVDVTRKGIVLFLKICPSVSPDKEMIEDLSTKDIHNIEQLNEILLDNISRRKLLIDVKIRQCEEKLAAQEEQLARKEEEREKYSSAVNLQMHEFSYNIAKKDYHDVKEEINEILRKIKILESEVGAKNNLLDIVNIELESLDKHRILNRRKINNLQINSQTLKHDVDILNIQIEQLNSKLTSLRIQLRLIVENFKEETGVNLQDYKALLESLKPILEATSIGQIYNEISLIRESINRLKELLLKYKNNANELEKVEGEKKK